MAPVARGSDSTSNGRGDGHGKQPSAHMLTCSSEGKAPIIPMIDRGGSETAVELLRELRRLREPQRGTLALRRNGAA
eukprot:453399-Pyramimonas_sp.AAC.1